MKCPKCNREIINRRKANCDYCNFLLPQELRFTEEQIKKLDNMNDQEKKRHREWNKSTNDSMTGSDGAGYIDLGGF
jgi:ribosomal protein L37E